MIANNGEQMLVHNPRKPKMGTPVDDAPLESNGDAPQLPSSEPLVAKTRVWKSEQLLGGHSEVIIVHDGQQYRLRHTRHGKLILYK